MRNKNEETSMADGSRMLNAENRRRKIGAPCIHSDDSSPITRHASLASCHSSLPRAGLSFITRHSSLVSRHLSLMLCTLLWVGIAQAQVQNVVDQILVIVNDGIITKSDVLWDMSMDNQSPSPTGPVSKDVMLLKLEVLVDRKLLAQEAARIPSAEITRAELEKKLNEIIGGFASEADFRKRVESVGLTPAKLDELIKERILVERFVDFRFKSFVFIPEDEIKRYYDSELVPEIRARGQVPPPLDQVREELSELLKAQKIEQELDRWIREARQRADIIQLAEP